MEAPNRVPPGRFSFQRDRVTGFLSLGCRHGLVLISDLILKHYVVWDPLTGDQHQVAIPPGLDLKTTKVFGSVVRAVGYVNFQVVFVGSRYMQLLACVYLSETGVWGDLVSTPVPSEPGSDAYLLLSLFGIRVSVEPALLVGGCLHWIFNTSSDSNHILEFDIQKQSLAVIPVPVVVSEYSRNFKVIRADGGGLGFLLVSDFTTRIWKRETDCDGVASWVLGRTVEPDKLLSLNSEVEDNMMILGYAEENNVVFLRASAGVYEVQLQSLQFKLIRTDTAYPYHPFKCVYTADIGGEYNGAELLHNA